MTKQDSKKRNLPRHLVIRACESPFLWAAALTAVFYFIISQESMAQTVLRRYTTEHAVEYVITAFFIWGLTEVAFRMAGYPGEWRALEKLRMPTAPSHDAWAEAAALQGFLERQSPALRESRFGRRLQDVANGMQRMPSTEELPEYLRQLTDQDEARSHANYALVRFIVWLAPVLGFLGTVVHFGTALSGLSPDTIADQLGHIVGEMGTAFNTTTVALAASTSMMFALFIGERVERQLVQAIDRRVDHEVLPRFIRADQRKVSLTQSSDPLSREVLQIVETSMSHYLQLLSESLRQLLERADERASQQFANWQTVQGRLDDRASEQLELMRAALAQVTGQSNRLDKTTVALTSLLESHGQLSTVQASLANNLRLLHDTQQFDEAIHQLTAAVHLLTARQRALPLGDSRAA